jgi:DNA-binding YbaB/EbfC family protein
MDFMSLLGQLKEVQKKMEEARNSLDSITVEVEVGAGLVKVKATASQRIIDITLDEKALQEKEMLEDLICSGVNKALQEARKKAEETFRQVTANLLPPGFEHLNPFRS